MSGSWEREKYDIDAYQHELRENESRINWLVNRPKICSPCRPPAPGYIAGQGVSVDPTRHLVDVESDLLNMKRPSSKCPGKKYMPDCPKLENCGEGYPCGGGVVSGCNNSQPKLSHLSQCEMYSVDTRGTHPICTYRGLGFDRFTPLCQNPQERGNWEHPGEVNINYRLVVKDNHRPCIPQPIDPTAALPVGGDMPCEPVGRDACAAPTTNLSADRWSLQ